MLNEGERVKSLSLFSPKIGCGCMRSLYPQLEHDEDETLLSQSLSGSVYPYAIRVSANVEVEWTPLGIMPYPARLLLDGYQGTHCSQ